MVELETLVIEFPGFRLGPLDLSVAAGECFILLGPTGAGKTLILEAIAGSMGITQGCIRINGKEVTGLPPEKRGIGIVYQDFALFPHLSVIDNITYGLRYSRKNRVSRRQAEEQIEHLMAHTGIAHLKDRDVTTLSGGEKQRVALVRALSVNPSLLLLDEPLSALDRGIRYDIQNLLKTLHRETGTTFLMVTHDFTEAVFLGQRAAVLHEGKIEQTGALLDILRHPQSPFVAKFVGIPNVFSATFRGRQARVGPAAFHVADPPDRGAGHMAIRPEDIRIHRPPGPGSAANVLSGRIRDMADHGPYGEMSVQTEELVFKVTLPRRELIDFYNAPPAEIFIEIPPDRIHTF